MSHLHSQAIPHLANNNFDAQQHQFLLFTPQGANHMLKMAPSAEQYQQYQQKNSSGKLIQQSNVTGSSTRHGSEETHMKTVKSLNNPLPRPADFHNQQLLSKITTPNSLSVSEIPNYFPQSNPQFPSSNHQSGSRLSDQSKQFQFNSTTKTNTSQLHPYISMHTPSTAAPDEDKLPSSQNSYLRQNQEVSRFNLSSSTPPVHLSTQKVESNVEKAIQSCHLHPQKRVKYQMRDNSREKFCSTCAVEFAGQGIPIQEIVQSQTSKETQMSCLLTEMTKVQLMNESLTHCFEKKLKFIKDECLKQTQIIHEFYSTIETALFAQKIEILNKLNTHMWEAINVIEQKRNEALIHEKRFMRYAAEIEKNRSRILAEINSSKVHSILQYYYEELDQTKKNITEIYSTTAVSLVSFNEQKLAQESQTLLKMIQKDLFKVNLCNSTLSDQIPVNSYSQSSPVPNNLPNQLSRFMTNPESIKSPSNKNKQIKSSEGQQNKAFLLNKMKEKLPANQLEKIKPSEQGITTTATDTIDVSASEKQQTQESDDLSYVPLIEQNFSKVTNKSNISQNKIISYSDIHDEPLSNIYLPQKCTTESTDRRNSKQIKLQLLQQQSLPAMSFAFQSPQSQKNQTDSSMTSQQLSENKTVSQSKFRQGISTDPSMLSSSKNKSVNYTNKQGFQRNLLITELTDCQREQKRTSLSAASQQLPVFLAQFFDKHKFGNIPYNENHQGKKQYTSSNNPTKFLQMNNYLEDKQQHSLPTENKQSLSNTTLFTQSSRSNNNVTSHLKQQLNHQIHNNNIKGYLSLNQAQFSNLDSSQQTAKN